MIFLFRLFLILLLLYLVRAVLTAIRRPSRASRPGNPPAVRGSMVKDPVCGTYLDVTLALWETRNGREVYFCSEACRQKY